MSHPPTADVIVLGAAGSAAAYHLARRGAGVLGVDRYVPPHAGARWSTGCPSRS